MSLVSYERFEPVSGNVKGTLVVLAGVGCGAFLFREDVPKVFPDFRVFLFNNPGIGETECPALLTVEAIADEVMKSLRKAGVAEPFDVLGHSMGGFTAQRLAHRFAVNVRRLVLVSTSYGGKDLADATKKIMDSVTLRDAMSFLGSSEKSPEAEVESLKWAFSEAFWQRNPEEFQRFARFYLANKVRRGVFISHTLCGARFDGEAEALKLSQPALVVHGTDDNVVPVDLGIHLAQALPNATLWTLGGCGHFPMVEVSGFWPRVQEFLTQKESV